MISDLYRTEIQHRNMGMFSGYANILSDLFIPIDLAKSLEIEYVAKNQLPPYNIGFYNEFPEWLTYYKTITIIKL